MHVVETQFHIVSCLMQTETILFGDRYILPALIRARTIIIIIINILWSSLFEKHYLQPESNSNSILSHIFMADHVVKNKK